MVGLVYDQFRRSSTGRMLAAKQTVIDRPISDRAGPVSDERVCVRSKRFIYTRIARGAKCKCQPFRSVFGAVKPTTFANINQFNSNYIKYYYIYKWLNENNWMNSGMKKRRKNEWTNQWIFRSIIVNFNKSKSITIRLITINPKILIDQN